MLQSIHYEEVRNNVKKNQKKLEKERNLKLQTLEKKDLKDFAIKQEKIKMYEERKKILNSKINFQLEMKIQEQRVNQILNKKYC